jgi:hypothetical protein
MGCKKYAIFVINMITENVSIHFPNNVTVIHSKCLVDHCYYLLIVIKYFVAQSDHMK